MKNKGVRMAWVTDPSGNPLPPMGGGAVPEIHGRKKSDVTACGNIYERSYSSA